MKKSVLITDLQKLINQWRKRKISDFNALKLLDIYLGIPAYMDRDGMYPVENLYDLSMGLKFRSTRHMLEAVKHSGTFIIIEADNAYGMRGFYSPLLYEKKNDKENGCADLSKKTPCNLPGNLHDGNIYNNINYTNNNIPSGRSFGENKDGSKEFSAASKGEGFRACEEGTPGMGEARKFFHLISQNEDQKARYLLRLIDRFEQEEGVERAVAREMLVAMVNKELIPHFDAQERFKSTGHPGRLRWLENLLKTPGARTMMDRAATEVREQQRKDALEKCRRRQENRPLCEFEWMDPETGIRFYEDDIEGSVRIPKEAPPRPSATAVWNVLSKEWK